MTEEKKPTINYDKFCWIPGDFTVSDPPAKKPKKSKPEKNPDVATDDDYILAHYPLLRDYHLGFLPGIWANLRANITKSMDTVQRAGEVAAAQLASQYNKERATLDEDIATRSQADKLSKKEAIMKLANWLTEHDFRRAITDLSGSQTLHEDEVQHGQIDVYPSKTRNT